jgi:hypothetical protein
LVLEDEFIDLVILELKNLWPVGCLRQLFIFAKANREGSSPLCIKRWGTGDS